MNKVYTCSDLHGRYDLWKMIDDFTDDTDKIYVLGDCGDRGPEGWRVIKEVYNSPKTIMLKGNHEDMLTKSMRAYIKYPEDERDMYFLCSHDYRLCVSNGGEKTFSDWLKEPHRNTWISKLENLPLEEIYINKSGQRIVLTHAGYTPNILGIVKPSDYLWDRYHFIAPWNEDYPDTYIIHGHTPIPYLHFYNWDEEKILGPGVHWYCEDNNGILRKCDIDCGAVFTGHTALLNLDTFEQHLFMAEDYDKDAIYD